MKRMVKASYRMLWLISACCNPYLSNTSALDRLYGAIMALDEGTTDFKILFNFYHKLKFNKLALGGRINLDNVPKRLHKHEVEENDN